MPHRCMNCGEVFEDDSDKLIDGCDCGCSLFMYESDPEKSESELNEEKEKVESDIQDMIIEGEEERGNIQIEFDLDSIKVKDEGVYELNISRLLNEMPLIISKSEGVYHIDLPSAFKKQKGEVDVESL
ncbi:Zn-ribbon domain-containing protein [Candidatus Nanosalina sp. VS9-1]|uniref:Zn-ribbon domain-containing protein n=1 Tax=Candidatus Nanosalina sp. VS9-1 TaxID=3388566 RepID=UPI0039DF537E